MQSNIQSICIVGAGFRGLGILERIVAYTKKYELPRPLRVHLIDPVSDGPEQYDIHQPDYLLLNIVCGQVSLFPDAVSVNGCPPTTGPSLYEWVCERGLLLDEDGFTVGVTGRTIVYGDFLPRRVLGEYLLWCRELIKSQATSFVDIVEHKAKATDLSSVENRFIVELANGKYIDTDYLFISVGQIADPIAADFGNKSARYINRPYPLPQQLECIKPRDTVAISGLGLSAIDAILALTIGRGGKMLNCAGGDRYIPSGKEPRIVAFSRSGLPYRARPTLGAPLTYNPIAFTRSSIDALRVKRGLKLDYDRDVLPLIFIEMRVAYRRAQYGRDFGWSKAQDFLDDSRNAFISGELEFFLAELDSRDPTAFDPKLVYFELSSTLNAFDSNAFIDSDAYQSWFQSCLSKDIEEARLGTALSPLKAALEICREFRDIIRYAVEFDGLTKESSDRFFSIHTQALNRIGVGPQKERAAEILALIQAKILDISLGPDPKVLWDEPLCQWKLSSSLLQVQHQVIADWMYHGSTSRLKHLIDDSSIVGAMARRGFLRQRYPESSVIYAVDIDQYYHPISNSGIANERIWIMGLLCEGVTFYNGYVTSPGRFVRSQYDADCAVAQIFSLMKQKSNY